MTERHFKCRTLLVTSLLLALICSISHNVFLLKFLLSPSFPLQTECSTSDLIRRLLITAVHLPAIAIIVLLGVIAVCLKSFPISIVFLVLLWLSALPKFALAALNWSADYTPCLNIIRWQVKNCQHHDQLWRVEQKYNCCGVYSYHDYTHKDMEIPYTCCITDQHHCSVEAVQNTEGCLSKMMEAYKLTPHYDIEMTLYITSEVLWAIAAMFGIWYFLELLSHNYMMKVRRRRQLEEARRKARLERFVKRQTEVEIAEQILSRRKEKRAKKKKKRRKRINRDHILRVRMP